MIKELNVKEDYEKTISCYTITNYHYIHCLMEGIVAFVIVGLFVTAIPLVLAVLFYKWLARKRLKLLAISIITIVFAFLIYNIYFAIYPREEFYAMEFKKATLKDLPETAHFLKKEASYPDTHGKYNAAFLIEVEQRDFNLLNAELSRDKRFKRGAIYWSEEVSNVTDGYKQNEIDSGLVSTDTEGRDYYYLKFLQDRKTVLVCTENN
jgi:hypothetical protein